MYQLCNLGINSVKGLVFEVNIEVNICLPNTMLQLIILFYQRTVTATNKLIYNENQVICLCFRCVYFSEGLVMM